MAVSIDENYIVTIYNKIPLDNNSYIFVPVSFAKGKINIENRCFIDELGVEYKEMNNNEIDSISSCYSSICSINKLREHFKEDTEYNDALKTYIDNSMKSIIVIEKNENGVNKKYEFTIKQLGEVLNEVKDSNEETVKDFIDLEEEIIEELDNGKYNRKELEELRRNLVENDKVIERIISNINRTIGRKSRKTSLEYYKKLETDLYLSLGKLSSKIDNGEYSLTDLFEMSDRVNEINKFMKSIHTDIEYQLFASSTGESDKVLPKGEDDETIKELIREDYENTINPKEEITIKNNSYSELGLLDVKEVLNKIKKTLIGQDEPAKHLLIELNSIISGGEKTPILITGDTGVGKTLLMTLVGKELNRVFYKIDSTTLTIPGYVGTDIEEELWRLYEKSGRDLKKAENAIVFFDEIDKKGSPHKSDVSGQGVLNVLLSFLEGGTYQACETMSSLRGQRVNMSTKNMIIVLGGSFKDVYDNINDKRSMGFGAIQKEKIVPDEEDFRNKAGMTAEFMGRLPIRIRLNDLDEEKLFHILKDSDSSAVLERKKQFEKHGVKLTFSDEYLKKLSREAIKKKTGARGLKSAVYETTWEALGDVNENLGKYDEIIVSEETVDNPKIYTKINKKNRGQ